MGMFMKTPYCEKREDGQARCQGTCWDYVGNGYRSDRQCGRVGRMPDAETGKLYCGTHHPGKVKERTDKRHAKWEEQYKNEQAWRSRQYEREDAALDAVNLLRSLVRREGALGGKDRDRAEKILNRYDDNVNPREE